MLPEKQIESLYLVLGQTIRKKREEKGLKQSHFAVMLKISRASLVNIEQGRQRPPLHLLYDIAEQLVVPVIDLLPTFEKEKGENLNFKIERKIAEESAGNLEVKEKLLEFVRSQRKTIKK